MLYDTSIPDYNIHRLNLDAALLTNNAAFIGFLVDEYLRPYVLGQFALMTDVNGVSGSDANRQSIVDAANGTVIMYDFCALVADCIETNETTRNAISKLLRDSGNGGASNGTATVIGSDSLVYSQDNIMTGQDCTNQGIMGEAIAIVEALNGIAEDWLQKFSASSFPYEFALAIIEATPLIGHLTPNDLGIIIDWISDEVTTQYVGAYDTQLRNEAACLLYSYACVDCALSIDDMLQAFSAQVSIGINPSKNWQSLMEDISNLSIADQIVYGVWLIILGTWKTGDLFLGLNGSAVLTYSAQTSTPTDPNVIGCDPCAGVCVYDFTLGSYGNTWYSDASNPPSSVYVQGVGWETVNRLPNVAEETNRIETLAVAQLLSCGNTMRITYDVIQASDRSDDNLRVRCGSLNASSPKLTIGNNQTYDFDISAADGSDLDVRCGNSNPNVDTPSETIIKKVEILP